MSAALFHDVMGEPHAPLKYMRFPWGLGESSTINKSWPGVWLLRGGLLVAAGAAVRCLPCCILYAAVLEVSESLFIYFMRGF